MLNFKKHSLFILLAMLILLAIPMSFASDVADTVGIDDSSDIIQYGDDSNVLSYSDNDNIEVNDEESYANDILSDASVYESTPSPTSVNYTVGESCPVDVNISYVTPDEDYWTGLDLTGANMYVYVNGTGVEIPSVNSEAKSFSVDLKDVDYEFEAGKTYSLVFRAPTGILSYASVDLSDCQLNPLIVNVMAGTTEPEYLYVSTPSPANVTISKGESCNVTFVLEYPDDYDLDEVPIYVFFDGSFFGDEIDVDHYAKSVTIDLADFADDLTVGNHTVIVRHVNDIMDYNDIGAADRLLNPLTVIVEDAEAVVESTYVSTPVPNATDYVKGESEVITVNVVYDDYWNDDLSWYGMYVYINGEDVANRVAIDGVKANDTSFEFDLKDISDKLVNGVNNLTFHPNLGALEGTFAGPYTFNNLTVNVGEAPEPEYLYVSTPSPAEVTITAGESCNVTFVLEYPDDYDLDEVPIYVFFDGSFFGDEIDVDHYAKSVTIDLADFADDLTVGNHTVIVRHVNDIMDYNDIGAADRLLNPLTVVVEEPEPEYLYVSTPSPAEVTITAGESCNVTFVLEYPDDYDLDEVPIYVFFDGSFFGDEIDVDHYAKSVTIDLADFADDLTVGNHTVIVRHVNDIMDYNDIGAADRKLNPLTVIVKDAEADDNSTYVSTPVPNEIDYVIGESEVITVNVVYDDYWNEDLSWYSMYVYINGEDFANRVAIDGVKANDTSFEFDLKDISDKLVSGVNNLTFHPNLGALEGTFVGPYTFNNLTVNVKSDEPAEKLNTTMTVEAYANRDGSADIDVEFEDYVNGTLTLFKDGVEFDSQEIEDDFYAQFHIDHLDKGNYTFRVVFDSEQFNTLEESDSISVDYGFMYFYLAEEEVNVGENFTALITLPDDANGTVTVTIGEHEYVINVTGGLMQVPIPALEKGSFTVYCNYSGDANYYARSSDATLKVKSTEPSVDYYGIIYVDVNGSDSNNGSDNSPVATIAKAIELASNDNNTEHKIVIREGTYAEHDLNITSALDISGEGNVVIDAEQLGRILNINTAADVSVSGITFKNGKASDAGAINIKDAKATIDNCVFTENEASSGAAIVVDADDVKLTNDVFTNNTGRNGAVKIGKYSWSTRKSSGSNSLIENCTFDNNHNSIYGNCIGLDIEEATTGIKIIGSNFTNNKGESYSEHGALYIKGDDVVVDGCLFENNSMGMAAAVQIDGENVVIQNSKFINNTVSTGLYTRSGAIEIQSPAQIINNTFINNGGDECRQGGAIDIVYAEYGGDILISGNKFINNSAIKGAAIYVDGGSEDGCEFDSVTIEDNIFEGNEALQGAGIYTATSDVPIDIKNNEFKDNNAELGSGIYVDSTIVNLEGNTMANEDIYLDGVAYVDTETTLTFDAPAQAFKGETVNVTATLTDDMNNSISGVSIAFTANGENIGEAIIENGVATVQLNITDATEYIISGSSDLDSTIKTAAINVVLNATVEIPDVSGEAGNEITVPVVVKVDGESVDNDNVSVVFGNETFNVPVNNGTANVQLTLPKDAGDYNLTVSYGGIDETKVVTVAPVSEVASIISINMVNGKVVTGILTDINYNPIADSVVEYSINGVNANVTTGSDGTFKFEVQYDVKTDISFAGNEKILPSNTSIIIKDVAPVRDSTVIVGNNFTQYALDYNAGERGQNFTVQLKDSNGNILANKTVLIGYNGKVLERVTNATGHASVQINLRDANRLTFAVTFLGDEDYNASMSVYLITINKKPVTITAAAKTYKATAKTKKYTVTLKTIKGSSADGKVYFGAGKKVTMKINGKTYTAKTNAKGQATFSLKITKKGKFTAKVSYAGDTTYKAVNKSVKITIK